MIVQDGGSSDGTLEVLQKYGNRISVRSELDSGQSEALNRAITRASGDVLIWLNADDVMVPGAIGAAASAFAAAPDAQFVYGDFEFIGPDGAILRRFRSSPYDPRRVFTHGCYIFSGSIFYKRTLMDRVGPFNEQLDACMDFDYLLRLGSVKAVQLGRPVAQFRMSGAGKSTRMRSRFLRESHAIRWRAAGGSKRLRALTILLDIRDSGYLLTQRLRLTRAWSHVRGNRRL